MCLGSMCRAAELCGRGLCMAGSSSKRLMKKDVKVGYGLLALFFAIALGIIMFFLSDWFSFAASFLGCDEKNVEASCLGLSAAFRLSLCLGVFHFIIALACLTRDGFAKCINEGLWGLKMCFIGLMFLGSFFIKNAFFIKYSDYAIYLSFIYLFVQMVSVIDAMYLWAEFWAKKFDTGNKCYGCLLIFATLGMYVATGAIMFYSFKFFWIAGCFWNKVILCSMSFFVVVFTVFILLKFHPKGSLITSGSISLYGTFLAWTAFVSYPNSTTKGDPVCNPIVTEKWSMFLQLGTSLFVAFICTFYWSMSGSSSKVMAEAGVNAIVDDEGDDIDQQEVQGTDEEGGKVLHGRDRLLDSIEEGGENDFRAYEDNSYLKFHAFMMLYSIYLSPLFTNWGNTQYSDNKGWAYQSSGKGAPFTIKLCITIFSMLLYLWTIVAPKVLSDRNFE